MAGVPAYCDNCKHSFVSSRINISDSIGVSLAGNIVDCPRCGRDARVIDGVISVRNEELELLAGPKWSYALVNRLRAAAERAKQTEDADTLLKEVASVSPALAEALRPIARRKSFWFLLAVLLMICRININFNVDVDMNELVHTAVTSLEKTQDQKKAVEAELKVAVETKVDASKILEGKKLSKRKRQRLRGQLRSRR